MSKYTNLRKVISWGDPGITRVVTIGLLTAFGAVSSLVIPILVQRAIDGFHGIDSLKSLPFFYILGAWVLSLLLSGLGIYLTGMIGVRMLLNLRTKLYAKSVRFPMSYFDSTSSSEPASRIVNDPSAIYLLVSNQLQPVVSGTIIMVGSLIILWILDWQLTTIMASTLIVTVLLMSPISRRLSKISQDYQETESTLLNKLVESFSNIRLVKASTAERFYEGSVKNTIDDMYTLRKKSIKVFAMLAPLTGLTVLAATIVILAIAAIRVSAGEITMGTLIAYVMFVNNIVFPMTQLASFKASLDYAVGAAERIHELLMVDTEDFREEGETSIDISEIKFDGVNFEYEREKPILNDINLSVGKNQTIALVGESGAGKSTIFALLLNFYKLSSGNIFIGGKAISNYSLTALRKQIAYVAQDVPILDGTIRDNLTVGLDFDGDDKEMFEALKLARLDQFVMGLENGLDARVGERGAKLSGGQRQRIAIARAVLKRAPVLLCDEATSSLDSTTEFEIQMAMKKLTSNRTTIIAAHRLSTVIDADKIFVLKAGSVIGSGSHSQLMDSMPYYRELVDRQLSVFNEVNEKNEVEELEFL